MTTYGYFSSMKLRKPWDTSSIRKFLLETGLFSEPTKGSFKHIELYFSAHLSFIAADLPRGYNYNENETNYIDIIMPSDFRPILDLLKMLEDFLGTRFIHESDNEYDEVNVFWD